MRLMASPDRETLDRFQGLMAGIVIGDVLGHPVEGHRTVSEMYLEEIRTKPRSLVYTDDTAMSIAVAESLLGCDGFDGADMAKRFADEYQANPFRGYGRNVVDVFERVSNGVHWETAAQVQFDGTGSYGNGAAMRVGPVALWAYPDLETTRRVAAETARVTHTHPIGVEGAVIQATAAHHALGQGYDPDRLLSDLHGLCETEEFRAKLDALESCLDRNDDESARLHLGNWVAAHNSVVTALYCFLLATDFEDAILRAIRMGGDTDTIASMTGALAGARFGIGSVPDIWREVEGFEHMIDLATSLSLR